MIPPDDERAWAIHDVLLDEAKGVVADAFDVAVQWIAAAERRIDQLEREVSPGFGRRHIPNLRWQPKTPVTPVDDGETWIKEGGNGGR